MKRLTLVVALLATFACREKPAAQNAPTQTPATPGAAGPAGASPAAAAALPTSDPAPSFDLPLVGGGNVTLASLAGKTVLIDFWATWCPPCLEEVPELNAISRELQGKNASILAISVDTLSLEALTEWLAERDVTYRVALGDTDLAGMYGADAFPFHVVVGPDGKVLERLAAGFHDREQLRAVLARHTKP